jgi:hypothetical protein
MWFHSITRGFFRRTIVKASFFGTALLFASAGMSAYGASVSFDFNSLSAGVTNGTTTQNNAADALVQTYMQGVLNGIFGTNIVTVTVTGAIADQAYNGEGNVVGQGAKSLTLGTSDNATNNSTLTPTTTYDTFLANTSDASTQVSSQISMVFSGLTVSALSFDYEIFPDGTCAVLNSANCGGSPTGGIYPNQPDLELTAGTGGSDSAVTSFGTSGTQYGYTPVGSGGTDGTSTHSPSSGTSSAETSPQYIGSISSASPLALSNATDLNFIDWPATIGIDNLKISYTQTKFAPPAVPEPTSVLLLGTVLSGLFFATKRMRKA